MIMEEDTKGAPVIDAIVAKLEKFAENSRSMLPNGPASQLAKAIGVQPNGAFYQAYKRWQSQRKATFVALKSDSDDETMDFVMREFSTLGMKVAQSIAELLGSHRETIRTAANLRVNDLTQAYSNLQVQFDEVVERLVAAENDRDAALAENAHLKGELEKFQCCNSDLRARVEELRRIHNDPGNSSASGDLIAPDMSGNTDSAVPVSRSEQPAGFTAPRGMQDRLAPSQTNRPRD
jgi:hypothetical protein